jgi:hypothetical protein
MTQPGPYPDAPRPGPVPAATPDPADGPGPPGAALRLGGAIFALLATAAASAVLGLLTGLLWSVVAPRALLTVQSRGVAYVVNPETNAFIAADGWFCILTGAAGLICGVVGYFVAVRRYGAIAVAGLVLGGVAASLLAMWVGQQRGLSGFRSTLASSPLGAQLRDPLALGGRGALAFWPLFTALAIGALELASQSADRKRLDAARAAHLTPPPPASGESGFGHTGA